MREALVARILLLSRKRVNSVSLGESKAALTDGRLLQCSIVRNKNRYPPDARWKRILRSRFFLWRRIRSKPADYLAARLC